MGVSLPLQMVEGHVAAKFRDTNQNNNLDVGDVAVGGKTEFTVTDYDVKSFDHLDSFLERASGGRVDIFPDGKDPQKAELLVFRHPGHSVAVVQPDGYDLADYPLYREPNETRINWTYQRKKRECANNRACRSRVDENYRQVLQSATRYQDSQRDLDWDERKFRGHFSVTANQVSTYLFVVDRYISAESDYRWDLWRLEMD